MRTPVGDPRRVCASSTEELLRRLDSHVNGKAEHVAGYRQLALIAARPRLAERSSASRPLARAPAGLLSGGIRCAEPGSRALEGALRVADAAQSRSALSAGPNRPSAATSARYGRVVQTDATLKERIRETFTPIHWPASVPNAEREAGVGVEVIDAGIAFDTPTYVLVARWIIAGLAFPPDDRFPSALLIDGEVRAVHSARLSELGSYRTVSLAPLGSHFPSQAHARKLAERFAPGFRRAVLQGRALVTAVR